MLKVEYLDIVPFVVQNQLTVQSVSPEMNQSSILASVPKSVWTFLLDYLTMTRYQ